MIEPGATLKNQSQIKGVKLLEISYFKIIIVLIFVYIAGATPPPMQTYIVQLQRGVDKVGPGHRMCRRMDAV
jgi:hypothetical protein